MHRRCASGPPALDVAWTPSPPGYAALAQTSAQPVCTKCSPAPQFGIPWGPEPEGGPSHADGGQPGWRAVQQACDETHQPITLRVGGTMAFWNAQPLVDRVKNFKTYKFHPCSLCSSKLHPRPASFTCRSRFSAQQHRILGQGTAGTSCWSWLTRVLSWSISQTVSCSYGWMSTRSILSARYSVMSQKTRKRLRYRILRSLLNSGQPNAGLTGRILVKVIEQEIG